MLKLIEVIDKNKKLPVFSNLDAMKMYNVAWQKVKVSTLVNCFAKAGISKKQQDATLGDADDPFKELQELNKNAQFLVKKATKGKLEIL